jgi:DNA-binding response OmpR family regulator
MRILVVDDEPDLCEILCFNLESEGFQTDSASSAEAAIDMMAQGHHYDLLLLDVMMERMSGYDLARRLRSDGNDVPIIFLTAKDTEDDTLQGFSLGADDYVTKPFSIREVMARVKAVLSRIATSDSSMHEREVCFGGLVIHPANKTVSVDGDPIALTRTEYDLLYLLLTRRGEVFSRQQLLDSVWPQDVIVSERTVDVNVARLRKKLNRYATCLVSKTGFGYSFEAKEP